MGKGARRIRPVSLDPSIFPASGCEPLHGYSETAVGGGCRGGPQAVVLHLAYRGRDRRRFSVELPIRPEGFGHEIPNGPSHPGAQVHTIRHVIDWDFRGRLAPHPSPDAPRFFLVS